MLLTYFISIFNYVIYFALWLFLLYWIHRLGHRSKFIMRFHGDHHGYINRVGNTSWNINNLLLFNDNYKSTIDLWLTEVIPTLLFGLITGQWWIFAFYYLWAALIQETVEHNPKFNIKFLTSGKWHLIHHKNSSYNYGLLFPIWDILFKTNRGL